MTHYKSLSQYVQEQIELFNIPETEHNFYKIRIKCTRVLKDLNLWDQAKTKLIGKKYTKIFTHEDLIQLSAIIRPYLLQRSNLSEKLFNEYAQKARDYQNELDSNQTQPSVTNTEIMMAMITALFNTQFEPINLNQWTRDKATMQRKNLTNDEYALTMKRLLNPVESYVKPKENPLP